ncbi:RHS repeat-associated core domain-containing protein [Pseudomonas sp. zjy_15]|uniref:RHS repeat-associated core domain-containing protein n=1 Tax=unclassified Pseudomonas TaxID=196821 RepID=UPI00370B907A
MVDSDKTTHFFLQQDKVHTALSGTSAMVCVRAQPVVLAETRLEQESTRTALLATDGVQTVVVVKSQAQGESVAYNAYGYHTPHDIPPHRPAFNGHLLVNSQYLLGNGYRSYNPALMRFQSPDSFSPFGAGGLNCYAYCMNDPVNFSDPDGHSPRLRSNSLPGLKSEAKMSRIVSGRVEKRPRRSSEGYYMSSSLMDETVQDILNGQPGWNTSGAPVQGSLQRGQASSSGQVTSSSMAGMRAGKGTVASDSWIYKRQKLDNTDIEELRNFNAENRYVFPGLDLEKSHELRVIAIDALAAGVNVRGALRDSKLQPTHSTAERVADTISRALRRIRGKRGSTSWRSD